MAEWSLALPALFLVPLAGLLFIMQLFALIFRVPV